MTVVLGTPVGQAASNADISQTLRWQAGKWESTRGVVEPESKGPTKAPSLITIKVTSAIRKSGKRVAVATLMGALLVGLALGLASWVNMRKSTAPAPAQIPVEMSSKPALPNAGVKEVDEPFPIPPQSNATAQESTAPVEAIIPRVDTAQPAQTQVQPVTVAKVQSTPVPPTKPGPKDDAKAPVGSAVVLDADVSPAKPPVQTQPSKLDQRIEQKPSVVTAVKVEQKLGSGLVAVTADGKFGLFTNPNTRLPEKHSVGEKLPNGETIKSIDKAAGKVVTDAKEYRLE